MRDDIYTLTDTTRAKLKKQLMKTVGLGFFTGSYSLFVIAIVTVFVQKQWSLSLTQASLLNATSLLSCALGAIIMGHLSDRWGRNRVYGWEMLLLVVGSIGSALAPNYAVLLLTRFVIGVAVGGDYPASGVLASEYVDKQTRGRFVLTVFSMQALGFMAGPILAMLLIYCHVPAVYSWRILLVVAAVPALFVGWNRRQMMESPRFLLSRPFAYEGRNSSRNAANDADQGSYYCQRSFKEIRWLKTLLGTAGAWFFLDLAFYGNILSFYFLVKALSWHLTLMDKVMCSTFLFAVFAFPGYLCAARWVDVMGRRLMQSLGFFILALMYMLLAYLPMMTTHFWLFVTCYGLSLFFVNFGPNATTFLLAAESFPTSIRARGHGYSVAVGKLGAFLGVFALPVVGRAYGLHLVFFLLAVSAVAGLVCTHLLPEMTNQSLESMENMNSRAC